MEYLDLRPLSLGEILDRTFTLYKRHFVLFAGISLIPNLLILAFQMAQLFLVKMPHLPVPQNTPQEITQFQASGAGLLSGLLLGAVLAIVGVIVYLVAVLLANGATVMAVSKLYLGRPITVGESLRLARGELGTLFGVAILSGLVCLAGLIFLIIPGIYLALRLAVSVPAAMIENLGPRASLERSYGLTKNFAGRVFLIFLLYLVLVIAATSLFQYPFIIGIAFTKNDLGMLRVWLALMQIGGFAASVLVTPVITIATSLFYYDLRVRKEAFDLQIMMGGADKSFPGATPGVPSMLS